MTACMSAADVFEEVLGALYHMSSCGVINGVLSCTVRGIWLSLFSPLFFNIDLEPTI